MQVVKYVPLGFASLTATQLASAQNLPSIPAGATVAVLSPSAAGVTWRDDGVAPTATVGILVNAGSPYEYWGDLAALQVILATGTPVLSIAYYRIAG